jgi:hypothetical protein
MPQFVWLAVLMLAYPLVGYIPTHFLFRTFAPRAAK